MLSHLGLHGSNRREATSTLQHNSIRISPILWTFSLNTLLLTLTMTVLQAYNVMQTGLLFVILPQLNLGFSEYKICGDSECESKSNLFSYYYLLSLAHISLLFFNYPLTLSNINLFFVVVVVETVFFFNHPNNKKQFVYLKLKKNT